MQLNSKAKCLTWWNYCGTHQEASAQTLGDDKEQIYRNHQSKYQSIQQQSR